VGFECNVNKLKVGEYMKVKCKASVQDKNNGNWYVANKVYDLPKERAEEVVKAFNGRYFEYVEDVVEKVVETVLEEIKEEKPKRVRKSTKK
jgi:hypothetical protein